MTFTDPKRSSGLNHKYKTKKMDLSLDEYIRRKKAADSVSLVNMRTKDKEIIDKDDLDRSLDMMVLEKALSSQNISSSLSKFDRIRISANNDSDEDMENPSIKFAKEIEKMEHPDCCKSKPFRTVEEKMRVKIKSQQWRLNKDGRGNAQESNRHGGRIHKNYRRNNSNNNTKFVERGGFTFKYQNSDVESDNESGVVGIVRKNNRFNGPRFNHNAAGTPVHINMNWRGFFEGASRIIAPPPSPSIPTSTPGATNVNLQLAAEDLMEFLNFKKQKESSKHQKITFAEKYAQDARVDAMEEDFNSNMMERSSG